MENLIKFLENRIDDKMPLAGIVNVFEQMCCVPVEEDMILFETGTFSFTGESLFSFSMVRQFPNDEEEFYQIRVDVLYTSTNENKAFDEAIWNEDVDEPIFDYIRGSQAFAWCKNEQYIRVEIL